MDTYVNMWRIGFNSDSVMRDYAVTNVEAVVAFLRSAYDHVRDDPAASDADRAAVAAYRAAVEPAAQRLLTLPYIAPNDGFDELVAAIDDGERAAAQACGKLFWETDEDPVRVGIYIDHDTLADGVITLLRERGLSYPEDQLMISVRKLAHALLSVIASDIPAASERAEKWGKWYQKTCPERAPRGAVEACGWGQRVAQMAIDLALAAYERFKAPWMQPAQQQPDGCWRVSVSGTDLYEWAADVLTYIWAPASKR